MTPRIKQVLEHAEEITYRVRQNANKLHKPKPKFQIAEINYKEIFKPENQNVRHGK